MVAQGVEAEKAEAPQVFCLLAWHLGKSLISRCLTPPFLNSLRLPAPPPRARSLYGIFTFAEETAKPRGLALPCLVVCLLLGEGHSLPRPKGLVWVFSSFVCG